MVKQYNLTQVYKLTQVKYNNHGFFNYKIHFKLH